MNKINIAYFNTPFGEMILGSFSDRICMADWKDRKARKVIDSRLQKGLNATFIKEDNVVLKKAKAELDDYFKGKSQKFNMPILFIGTAFQKNVWEALMHIPYGQTVSYKKLAQNIDHESSVRAVASAVGANAISILVPCHRVIGTDGSLRGYAGGLEAKLGLLEIENDLFSV